MDKIINWLLQSTDNGATYLQVIIIGVLLCCCIASIFDSCKQISKDIGDDTENEDNS